MSAPVRAKRSAVEAAPAEALRRNEELPAVKVTQSRPGWYIFDLGQNMVGWTRLKIHGKPGQRITVRHGEMLNPDGTLYTVNLRGATATDFFLLAGTGEETLEPRFTFHGFRYVEVQGLDYRPEPAAVTGIVVHTPMRQTGHFACSSPLVNQLFHNIVWGQKGNYFEVPTDCPQRDERMGWTGDTQFFAPTAAYNFDVQPFFTRWLVTMCEDSQHADGSYAHVSPDMGCGAGSTAWGDAALLCTYNTYRVYGDTRVVAEHFSALERYMQFVASKSKDFVPNVGGFGDWLNLGGSASREVMDTAYYAHLARIMSEMAEAVGRTGDARRYATLAKQIRTRFAAFFKPDGTLTGCSQTGYALAFTMDLVPPGIAGEGGSQICRRGQALRLAPGHRLHRHSAAAAGPARRRPRRRGLQAAPAGDLPFMVVPSEARGDDHVGALGRLDARPWIPDHRHEFVQPLCLWLRGRVSLRRRGRNPRGEPRLRQDPHSTGAGRGIDLGRRKLPLDPRPDQDPLAALAPGSGANYRHPAEHDRYGLCAGRGSGQNHRIRQTGFPGRRREVRPHGKGRRGLRGWLGKLCVSKGRIE